VLSLSYRLHDSALDGWNGSKVCLELSDSNRLRIQPVDATH